MEKTPHCRNWANYYNNNDKTTTKIPTLHPGTHARVLHTWRGNFTMCAQIFLTFYKRLHAGWAEILSAGMVEVSNMARKLAGFSPLETPVEDPMRVKFSASKYVRARSMAPSKRATVVRDALFL